MLLEWLGYDIHPRRRRCEIATAASHRRREKDGVAKRHAQRCSGVHPALSHLGSPSWTTRLAPEQVCTRVALPPAWYAESCAPHQRRRSATRHAQQGQPKAVQRQAARSVIGHSRMASQKSTAQRAERTGTFTARRFVPTAPNSSPGRPAPFVQGLPRSPLRTSDAAKVCGMIPLRAKPNLCTYGYSAAETGTPSERAAVENPLPPAQV